MKFKLSVLAASALFFSFAQTTSVAMTLTPLPVQDPLSRLKAESQIDFGWQVQNEVQDELGRRALRVVHTWRGIVIHQSESVWLQDARGQVLFETTHDLRQELRTSLAQVGGKALQTVPAISAGQALQAVGGSKAMVATLVLHPRLKYMPDTSKGADALDMVRTVEGFDLAWLIKSSAAPGVRWVVDAVNGRVLTSAGSGEDGAIGQALQSLLASPGTEWFSGPVPNTLTEPKNTWFANIGASDQAVKPLMRMLNMLVNGSAADGVVGIGGAKARALVDLALRQKLAGPPDYASLRNAMLAAAQDLHGVNSREGDSVKRAFSAIRVGANLAVAPICTSIGFSPSNPMPWSGGQISATATCSGTITSYNWVAGTTPLESHGRTASGVLGINTTGQTASAQVCVTPLSGTIAGPQKCVTLQQYSLQKPTCSSIDLAPYPVGVNGGSYQATGNCGGAGTLIWQWQVTANGSTTTLPDNGRFISRTFDTNPTTSPRLETVCVTAVNEAGASNPICKQETQISNKAPTCNSITFNPPEIPHTGGNATATANCSGGSTITGYRWTFLDKPVDANGNIISGTFPLNTEAAPKYYKVCVTATNLIGASNTICPSVKQQ